MKRALVVDDTKNIRNLLTTCLELNDFDVVTASNGEDALKIALSECFDLIFLDIKMPEISGTKVLKGIRDASIHTPVIIMTAFATVKNAVDCTKLGAIAYLQKPFTIEKVNSVLAEVSYSFQSGSSLESQLAESETLLKAQNLDEAYALLKNALSINPSYGKTYFLIGKVHENKNDLIEASKFFNIAKELGYNQ